MGKKKTKNKRNTELKVIFFIILIALVLFIVSTYAWFSTQRNVSITNLNGIVEVAEGLEISLNGQNWYNGIKLGKGEGEFDIIRDAYTNHRNLSPTELLPVSTLGIVQDGMQDIQFLRGKVEDAIRLKDIVEVSHDAGITNSEDQKFAGHFAFDIFLKNSSREGIEIDDLQLNYDSSVTIMENEEGVDKSSTGLQNTVRVALARFGGTKDGGGNFTGVAGINDEQADVLKKTGTGVAGADTVDITDVAIWEPNSNNHVPYIVTNNNRIKWSSADATKYNVYEYSAGNRGFGETTQIPTYALKASSLGKTIEDLYKWDGTETNLQQQMALQTTRTSDTDYSIAEGVQNLISTGSTSATDELGIEKFSIPANSISRLRVYVWLEGQDIDCINYASHGGGVTINLGLVKGSSVGSHEPTTGEP